MVKMECFQGSNLNNQASDLAGIKREVSFKLNIEKVFIGVECSSKDILGYFPNELLGRNINDFITAEGYGNIFDSCINTKIFITVSCKNGDIKHMWLLLKPEKNTDGDFVGYNGSFIDMSDYQDIQYGEQRFQNMVENSKDIIYRYEVIPQRRFVYLSKAVEYVLGHEVQKHYDDPMFVFKIAHPDDVHVLEEKAAGQADYSKPILTRWLHKDGHYVWIEDYARPLYDKKGNLIAIEGVCRDVSERKRLEEELNYLYYHDTLTGLKNRSYYEKVFNNLDTVVDEPVGIIICDLDNLKKVNDTLGHEAGDLFIKEAAKLLSKVEREGIFVTRMGGDEFVVLIQNASRQEVEQLYREVCLMVENYNSQNKAFKIEMSIGFAHSEKSLGHMKQVFCEADNNMYFHKGEKRKEKNKEEMK